MRKSILTLLLAISIASIFTACSTKRYGRLQNITELESQYLTCQAIKIEIDKAKKFINHIETNNEKFDKEYVFGILGDIGIGNRMEYNEAKKSAKDRLEDLIILQKQKQCN